jgi:hypothetical protein
MKLEAMLWMLILVSLALAIVSRKYRQYGLVVLGLAVATMVVVIALVRKNDLSTAPPSLQTRQSIRVDFEQSHVEKLDREDPEAKRRIAVSEIRFDQVRLSTESQPGTFESIRARLYNDSTRFTLTDYAYYLVIQDCVEKACTTIYDQHGLGSSVVPPNQARDVIVEIRPAETRDSPLLNFLGTPKVTLSPAGTRAYKSAQTP